jgi:hypothetical protein
MVDSRLKVVKIKRGPRECVSGGIHRHCRATAGRFARIASG